MTTPQQISKVSLSLLSPIAINYQGINFYPSVIIRQPGTLFEIIIRGIDRYSIYQTDETETKLILNQISKQSTELYVSEITDISSISVRTLKDFQNPLNFVDLYRL